MEWTSLTEHAYIFLCRCRCTELQVFFQMLRKAKVCLRETFVSEHRHVWKGNCNRLLEFDFRHNLLTQPNQSVILRFDSHLRNFLGWKMMVTCRTGSFEVPDWIQSGRNSAHAWEMTATEALENTRFFIMLADVSTEEHFSVATSAFIPKRVLSLM